MKQIRRHLVSQLRTLTPSELRIVSRLYGHDLFKVRPVQLPNELLQIASEVTDGCRQA